MGCSNSGVVPESLMETQPASPNTSEPSAEKKVSAGMDRAFEIFGPNLASFFEAVKADIELGEQKGVQLELPLTKSK
jgi:hypothetical protein